MFISLEYNNGIEKRRVLLRETKSNTIGNKHKKGAVFPC